jgi:hypothetical protein
MLFSINMKKTTCFLSYFSCLLPFGNFACISRLYTSTALRPLDCKILLVLFFIREFLALYLSQCDLRFPTLRDDPLGVFDCFGKSNPPFRKHNVFVSGYTIQIGLPFPVNVVSDFSYLSFCPNISSSLNAIGSVILSNSLVDWLIT